MFPVVLILEITHGSEHPLERIKVSSKLQIHLLESTMFPDLVMDIELEEPSRCRVPWMNIRTLHELDPTLAAQEARFLSMEQQRKCSERQPFV